MQIKYLGELYTISVTYERKSDGNIMLVGYTDGYMDDIKRVEVEIDHPDVIHMTEPAPANRTRII